MTRVVLKWSKWLSLSFGGILLALLLAVGFLLFTKPGLGVILWAGEKFVPQLKVDSYSGALLPRFTLNQVEFVDPDLGIDSKINAVTLGINSTCFTEASVCIDELAIDGLAFSLPELPPQTEAEPVQESAPMGNITTPIPVKVGRIALSNIDLNVLGNQISWERFTTALSFQGNRLQVSKTELNKIHVALAETAPSDAEPQPEKTGEPSAIVLPDVVLPLQVDLARLDIRDFKLQQATPIIVHHLGLQASAAGSNVSVPTLELDMPQVQGKLNAKVTLKQDYPLSLQLDATVKDPMAKGQKLSLSAKGSIAQLDLQAQLRALAEADLQAKLALLDRDIPFDIVLDKTKAQWPLVGEGDYFVNVDNLSGKGSLKGYSLNLVTQLSGKELPDLDLTLEGKGNLEQVELSALTLDTLGGSVNGDAMVNWKQPLNWLANLSLEHIQPGLQWPEAEGDISGTISTTGSLTQQGGWQVAVSQLDIDGILREYPLNIEGQLTASDMAGKGQFKLDTPGLVLSHGPNNVEAKGSLSEEWRMSLSLDLPELAKSVPELSGKAIGDVHLRGPMKEPKVKLALDVDAIDFQQQYKVKHITLSGDVTPLPEPKGNITLELEGGEYQDYLLQDLLLNFNGDQSQHNLTLDVDSNLVSTSLVLSGSLTDKPSIKWAGQLERMLLSSQQGEWELNQATKLGFDVKSQQASVAAHCWLQADSSLCLDEDIKVGEAGEAKLSINQFNFTQIAQFLPPETELFGEANAHVWAKWSANQSPEVKLDLELPQGGVSQKLNQPLELGWDKVMLNATLVKDRLQAKWSLDVTDNGDLTGQVTIPNVLSENRLIDGQLNLSTFHLDFLSPLLGEHSELKSNISTDLAISGPILHPKVNGKFLIDSMKLQGAVSPVQIDSGELAINFAGYQADLNAALNTPDGTLQLQGDADWQSMQDWRSKLRVFADELKVEVPPMATIKVVPDMTINASPNYAKIQGDISLPWGRVVVEQLPPSATGLSKDQVILNENLEPVSEESVMPFAVETDININIGDDFKLSAFGLEGDLRGRLNVAQKDKGPFITGEVNIVDGSYRSFGQDLIIEEGKILMSGPVDQPYVQITAIRNPDNTQDDVVAGVRVSGPASEPTVAIFSEPSMPQANALSYLLRGQDIDGESGGNAMTTTLIGLSLAKSGRVVGELGEAFGVQDLQLDTAGSGDDSQVTVSGYIMPGLQVKYGIGIFDSVGEFTVRYRLMKDLYVEAVTGVSSAVDILYQFEFN